MRRLIDGRVLMLTGLLWFAVGCGSAGTSSQGEDGLTMAFVTFSGLDIAQADTVNETVAQVDLCQDLCTSSGGGGDLQPEPFTSTAVSAVFVNRGKADIVLDAYTLNVPDSGVPAATRRISARLPGGRCRGADPQRECADNVDCGVIGACTHTESPVTILLYDFDFKQRTLQGECPFDVEAVTHDAELTFSGTDEAGQRFTVHTNYVSTFANFDNCQNQ